MSVCGYSWSNVIGYIDLCITLCWVGGMQWAYERFLLKSAAAVKNQLNKSRVCWPENENNDLKLYCKGRQS